MKNLKLKSARVAKDLTQQGLADAIGVSRQTISPIEKGDYNPTMDLYIAICKTLDQLFWGKLRTSLHPLEERSLGVFYYLTYKTGAKKIKEKTPPTDLPWTCFFDIMLNGSVYPI